MERLVEFIKQTPSWGTIVAVVAVSLSLVAQLLRSRLVRFRVVRNVEFANAKLAEVEQLFSIDSKNETRLEEARHVLRRQETSARWNKWSMHSLVFGQYVVGGVLATSFIQAALSKETVGVLGVLVLVSSLIHQRFRPDLQYRNASERAALLRALIRKAEDEIYAILSSQPEAKTAYSVRQMVSDGLSKIEALELADVSTGNGHEAAR